MGNSPTWFFTRVATTRGRKNAIAARVELDSMRGLAAATSATGSGQNGRLNSGTKDAKGRTRSHDVQSAGNLHCNGAFREGNHEDLASSRYETALSAPEAAFLRCAPAPPLSALGGRRCCTPGLFARGERTSLSGATYYDDRPSRCGRKLRCHRETVGRADEPVARSAHYH